MFKKVKMFRGHVPFHVISDFTSEEIVGTFYGKELQKTNQKV